MKILKKGIILTISLVLVFSLFYLYGDRVANRVEKDDSQPLSLEQMRAEIAREGHTFTVGETSARAVPLDQLCGLVIPPDWRETGKFDGGYQTEDTLPSSFDWRDYGMVTPIQDQGSCGSCWAFGTIGSYESCVAVAGGGLDDLSEEWLLDCNSFGYSCSGGWWAFDDLTNGVPLESCYPYVGVKGTCYTGCTKYHPMDAWYYVGNSSSVASTTDIKNAMYTHGPIAAAVYADYYFQAYTGGIFTNTASYQPNHAIVLVGWDDTGGYWILKNSWDTGWGEDGYMRIAYGANNVGYAAAYGVPEVVQQPPVANFSANPTTVQVGHSVQFTDLSTNNPTSWDWTFEGGTPSSSTAQNPVVTYNSTGTYDVSLTVSNAYGNDTETKLDYITVIPEQTTEIYVYDITQTITKRGVNYESTAVVTIWDTNNDPVADATVYITWSGVVSGSDSGVTGSSGTVSFKSARVKRTTGPFTITVDNVTHATLPYNSSLNIETSDTDSY